jgi:hypothetical protein
MPHPNPTNLTRAFTVAETLSADQQDALALEIEARVAELAHRHVTTTHDNEVERRLSQPANYANTDAVEAFFARHGVR